MDTFITVVQIATDTVIRMSILSNYRNLSEQMSADCFRKLNVRFWLRNLDIEKSDFRYLGFGPKLLSQKRELRAERVRAFRLKLLDKTVNK